MNKRTMALVGALAALLMLAPGCSKVAEKAVEKGGEKLIEGQTGGKVDIGKDGNLSVKTSDGEIKLDEDGYSMKTSDGEAVIGAGAKVPKNWPKLLALPKDAKVMSSITSGDTQQVSFQAAKSPNKWVEQLVETLDDEGWDESATMNSTDYSMYSYEKDGDSISITVLGGGDDEPTTVSLSYTIAEKDS